jgi:hypothetical protein
MRFRYGLLALLIPMGLSDLPARAQNADLKAVQEYFQEIIANLKKRDEAVDRDLKVLREEVKGLRRLLQGALEDKRGADLAKDAEVRHRLELQALQARNEQLMKRLGELEKALTKPKAAPPKEESRAIPAGGIQGKITRLDDRSGLFQIDIGFDAGLRSGDNLDVFRKQPEPKYLGTLRIMQVKTRSAAGQFVPAAGQNTLPQAGDDVGTLQRTKDR